MYLDITNIQVQFRKSTLFPFLTFEKIQFNNFSFLKDCLEKARTGNQLQEILRFLLNHRMDIDSYFDHGQTYKK